MIARAALAAAGLMGSVGVVAAEEPFFEPYWPSWNDIGDDPWSLLRDEILLSDAVRFGGSVGGDKSRIGVLPRNIDLRLAGLPKPMSGKPEANGGAAKNASKNREPQRVISDSFFGPGGRYMWGFMLGLAIAACAGLLMRFRK